MKDAYFNLKGADLDAAVAERVLGWQWWGATHQDQRFVALVPNRESAEDWFCPVSPWQRASAPLATEVVGDPTHPNWPSCQTWDVAMQCRKAMREHEAAFMAALVWVTHGRLVWEVHEGDLGQMTRVWMYATPADVCRAALGVVDGDLVAPMCCHG